MLKGVFLTNEEVESLQSLINMVSVNIDFTMEHRNNTETVYRFLTKASDCAIGLKKFMNEIKS